MKRAIPIDAAVESALLTWSNQKRQAYVGNGGWQSRSVIGRLQDEGPGAFGGRSASAHHQQWGEMYVGDGLAVQRIVGTLREIPRMTLTCYYLFRGHWCCPVSEQCAAIGITRAQYWPALQAAEEAISAGLQLLEQLRAA